MTHPYQQIIPAGHISAFEMALRSIVQKPAIEHMELLSGGLSGSSVYKIIMNGHPYTVKLDPSSTRRGNISSEILIQTSKAGIAPPLYYCSSENGISVTDFVASRPIQAAMPPEQIIDALGKKVRLLHSLPCSAKCLYLFENIDKGITDFRESKILRGVIIEDVLAHYSKIRQVYRCKNADKVLSHNDLNPGNILCDGTALWIIDWDTASLNDRFVDLAAIANFFVHTEEQELLLLHTYFDREPTAEEKARFFLMRQASRLIYGMLLAQVAARVKPADYHHNQEMEGYTLNRFGELIKAGEISLINYEGQFYYAKANFNEALLQMCSPRFEECLSLLKISRVANATVELPTS